MLTRRQLLELGAIGGAGLVVGRPSFASAAPPVVVGATPKLRKWREALPIPPVLDGRGGGKSFKIAARESTTWKFHPDLPATRTWGYWSDGPQAGLPYLGPTIEATRRPDDSVDTSVTIEWRNELGNAFLPNDPTIMGAVMPGEPAPIVPHLHGGENHPQFDGTPLQWFTKGGEKGPHYITNTFTYYNEQRASMVWYHDHALGNTRTNVYAGLAGLYFIRDDQDTGEAGNPLGLPAGPYEIPLVLQDKTFNADGSMFYPTQGVTAYHPQWVPEFFGDVAVVNAKIWPFVDVEPRRYRLRIVNGSQARFYNLHFADENSGRELPFTQIGAEGGLLRAPVPMTALLIAPGERADLIIDFAGQRNASFIVTNNARAPYPMGGRATLSQLLKIRVNRPLQGTDDTTPAADLQLPALASAARAVAHARAAPVRDARPAHRRPDPPQRRGRALPRRDRRTCPTSRPSRRPAPSRTGCWSTPQPTHIRSTSTSSPSKSSTDGRSTSTPTTPTPRRSTTPVPPSPPPPTRTAARTPSKPTPARSPESEPDSNSPTKARSNSQPASPTPNTSGTATSSNTKKTT